LSYRIVIYTKRKGISKFISCIINEKRAKLRSHFASLKMHRTHAHSKFQPKWVRKRTSQLAIAHRKSCFELFSDAQKSLASYWQCFLYLFLARNLQICKKFKSNKPRKVHPDNGLKWLCLILCIILNSLHQLFRYENHGQKDPRVLFFR
jgi:hypothetical protein